MTSDEHPADRRRNVSDGGFVKLWRRPCVNQRGRCVVVAALEKASPLQLGHSRLRDDRLAQRMVAADQPLVAMMKALEVRQRGHLRTLPVCPSVTLNARENKIPDAIQIPAL